MTLHHHHHHHEMSTQSQTATTDNDVRFSQPESPRRRRTAGVSLSPRAARWLGNNRIDRDDDDGRTTAAAGAVVGSVRSEEVVAVDVDDRSNKQGGGGGVYSAGFGGTPGLSRVGEVGLVGEEHKVCLLDSRWDNDARGSRPEVVAAEREVKRGEQHHQEDEEDRMVMAMMVEEYESDFEPEEE